MVSDDQILSLFEEICRKTCSYVGWWVWWRQVRQRRLTVDLVVFVVARKARLVIGIGNPGVLSHPLIHFGGPLNRFCWLPRFFGSGVHREVSSFLILKGLRVIHRHEEGCSLLGDPGRLYWE